MPELSNFEAALVQMAFYGGYGTMAIPAALFIRRYSYKSGILVGLGLYAAGAFLFYPAAANQQFGFFLASLYVLTFGLAFLETTANPFILSMGARATATQRLNLAQAFNPVGSLLGMLVAQLVVIDALRSDDYSAEAYAALGEAEALAVRTNDLDVISTPYIGLGVLVAVIAVAIALTKFPQTTEHVRMTIGEAWAKLRSNARYREGVLAQAFYVGAQIMCWTFIFQYVDHLNASRGPDEQLTATWYNMAAMISFLSGRWVCTYLMRAIDGARLMMYFAMGGVLFCAGTILLGGMAGLYCLIAVSVCMSLMFPTIYGIALDGMGDEAKLGSAGLVMAIVGGGAHAAPAGLHPRLGRPGLRGLGHRGLHPRGEFLVRAAAGVLGGGGGLRSAVGGGFVGARLCTIVHHGARLCAWRLFVPPFSNVPVNRRSCGDEATGGPAGRTAALAHNRERPCTVVHNREPSSAYHPNARNITRGNGFSGSRPRRSSEKAGFLRMGSLWVSTNSTRAPSGSSQ